ncbi:hypothetical protein IC582_023650 [Cucumis melo]
MWKKARVNKQGEYDNNDVQQVVHKITCNARMHIQKRLRVACLLMQISIMLRRYFKFYLSLS